MTRVETFAKPYELVRCVQAYVAFLRSTPGNLTDERARLTRALASMAELKLRQKSGDLVDRTAVDGQFLSRTAIFRHLPRAWSPPNAISKSALTFWRRKCARYWKGSPEGLAMGLR